MRWSPVKTLITVCFKRSSDTGRISNGLLDYSLIYLSFSLSFVRPSRISINETRAFTICTLIETCTMYLKNIYNVRITFDTSIFNFLSYCYTLYS